MTSTCIPTVCRPFSKALPTGALEGPDTAQDGPVLWRRGRRGRSASGGGSSLGAAGLAQPGRFLLLTPQSPSTPGPVSSMGGEAPGQGISREPGSRGAASVWPRPAPPAGRSRRPLPRLPFSAQAPAPPPAARRFGAAAGWAAQRVAVARESWPSLGMPVRSGTQVSARPGERVSRSRRG